MPNDIAVLTGVGPNAPPNVYGQINFAQGSGSLGNSVYSVLLLANMGGAGTASEGVLYGPDTQVTLQSAQDAVNLFGDGYPAARGFAKFISVNPASRVYVMPVPTATGTAASGTITITTAGTQTAGTINVTVGTTVITTVFGSADTVSNIATNICNNINAATSLPVSASPSSGVVNLTAKAVGARGNWIRVGAQVTSGSGPLVNGSLYTGRFFLSSGAGLDSAGYTTCINNLIASGQRFYRVITECGGDNVDATTFESVVANLIDFSAQPLVGIRQVALAGSVDTLAHTTAVATALNDARAEIINCKNLDVTPFELACQWGAAKSLFEFPFLTPGGVNFDNFGATATTQPYWHVPAPLDGSAPSASDIQTAVVSGVTILKVLPGNLTKVVKSCTTRFWTGTSSQFDGRIVDAGKVTICDYVLDDLVSTLSQAFQNKLVADDPVTGVVGSGIVTPKMVRNTVTSVLTQYGTAGLISLPQTLAGLAVQRGSNPTSRIEIEIPLWTADLLHSFTILINQTN